MSARGERGDHESNRHEFFVTDMPSRIHLVRTAKANAS